MTKQTPVLKIVLPKLPGVYLFKDKDDAILYIGKAKNLHNRVKSYFHKYKQDWKVQALLDEHASIEFIIVKNENEALVLEAELIQKHKPKYNTLLKEGNPFLYIMYKETIFPELKIVRNKKEKGKYFGPFLHKTQARKTLSYLRYIFRLNYCDKKIENGCLDYHIGNCAGSCKQDFDRDNYLFRMHLAVAVLEKNHTDFIQRTQEKMKEYSAQMFFEKARNLKNYLNNIHTIFATLESHYHQSNYADQIAITTTPKTYFAQMPADIDVQLQEFLKADHPIVTIDCFDISHFQGQYIVGSCVRFTQGKPEKNKFRRFKIKYLTDQNDYAALQEIVSRRYRENLDMPDLVVIDGGKGQLSAVQEVLSNVYTVSLAKREERLYGTHRKDGITLDATNNIGKLIIGLRDYAHHFAISYHRLLRSKNFSNK